MLKFKNEQKTSIHIDVFCWFLNFKTIAEPEWYMSHNLDIFYEKNIAYSGWFDDTIRLHLCTMSRQSTKLMPTSVPRFRWE